MKRWLGPALFLLLIAAHVAPIAALERFPTQDGPAHVATAWILQELERDPASPLHELYVQQPSLTNHAAAALLGALIPSVGAPAALRLLLAGYVVLLPLAVLWLLCAFDARARWPVFLVFPLLHGFLLHLGFLNLLLGMLGFTLALGVGRGSLQDPRPSRWLALAAVLVGTFLLHPFAAALAAVAVGALVAGRVRRSAWRGLVFPFLAACLPLVPCFAAFLGRHPLEPDDFAAVEHRLVSLATGGELVAYRHAEIGPGIAVHAVLFALAALALRRPRLRDADDGLALFAALVIVGLVLGPADLGIAGFLVGRTLPFVHLALLPWLARRLPAPPLGGLPWAAIASLASLAALAVRWPIQRAYAADLAAYSAAASPIEPGSTVLALNTARDRQSWEEAGQRCYPFFNAMDLVAVERQAVPFLSYQAAVGYFPLAYRPDRAPSAFAAPAGGEVRLRSPPFRFDLARYAAETGLAVDYVLVWTPPPSAATRAGEAAGLAEVRDQLERDYALAATSEHARLYRRRATGADAAPPR